MNAADGSGRHAVRANEFVQEAVDEISWSPDGNWLAMTLFYGAATSQIGLMPMVTGQRLQGSILTNASNGAFDPAWSPSGDWIAYAGRDGRNVDLFAIRSDGTQTVRLTTSGVVRAPTWSPDGAHLAYLSAQTNAFEVWVVDISRDDKGVIKASNPRQVTHDLSLDAISGITWGP
jgi:TolB protein